MPISIELPDEDLRLEFDDSYSNQQIADFIKRAPWKGQEDPKYLTEAEAEDTALSEQPPKLTLPPGVEIPAGQTQDIYEQPTWAQHPIIPPSVFEAGMKVAPQYWLGTQFPAGREYAKRLSELGAGLTSPEGLLTGLGLALIPEAVLPAGLAFGGQSVAAGAEELGQGQIGAGLADITAGGLMAAGGVMGPLRAVRPKGEPYAVHEEGAQLPSGMRPRYEAEQAGVKVPAEVSGEAPRIGGGKETLAEEAQILLTADQAELLERAALDAPEPIETEVKVAEVGSSDDPFATIRDQRSADFMTIDPENNRIIVRAEPFQRWLEYLRSRGKNEAEVKEAVTSRLNEEEIHLQTPPELAKEYWQSLSRFEQWINRNRYSTWNEGLTDTQLGHEALRFRIQQAQRMTPGEFLEMTRTQRWTWEGLTALEKAVRLIREQFTDAGSAARAVYDRALANIETAKNVHVPVSATDELPASRQRETQEDRSRYDELQKQISGLVQSGKFEGNELQNLWRESESIKNKYGGMPPPVDIPASRQRQLEGKLVRGFYREEDAIDFKEKLQGETQSKYYKVVPVGARFEVHEFDVMPQGAKPFQPPAARARQPELALEKMKPGEEREAVTTARPIQFEREAYRYLTDESSRLAEEFGKGGKPKPPTFSDFTKQLKVSAPGIQPGAAAELWERTVWRRLFNADGQTLSAFRRSLGLEKKLGDRPIVDTSKPPPPKAPGAMGIPGREELPGLREEALARREASRAAERGFRAGQRYRTRVITEIGMQMMKDAEEHIRLVTTKDISPEDIRITGGKNYSGFEALGPDIVNHRPTLEAVLTDNAAVFGGRFRKPESVTKRLTVLVNKITGKVDMVSTYRSPTSGVMLRDPTLSVGKAHRPLDSILKTYQPIYSVLLDKPVKNFRQSFENLADFNQRFGNDARSRVETEGPTEFPIAQELEPTEGAWEAGGPVQDAEAGALLDAIISEAGKLESPQDVIDAIPPLIRAGKGLAGERLTPTASPARQAISALRKLGLEIDRKHPGLDNESWTQRLANQIYETHKNAPSYEAFVARIIEQGGGRGGEFVPTPQVPPAAPGTVEVGRPRQKIVSKPGRAYTAEEWQNIVRERERITKEPQPAARIRDLKESAEEQSARVREQLKAVATRRTVKKDLPRILDGAERAGDQYALQARGAIELASMKKALGKQSKADRVDALRRREAAKAVIAANNRIAKAEEADLFLGDTTKGKAGLDQLEKDVNLGMQKAKSWATSRNPIQRHFGKRWLASATRLLGEINYARANWDDPALHATAKAILREGRDEAMHENVHGFPVTERQWYVPGRYESDFWNDRRISFAPFSGAMRVLGEQYRSGKVFRDYYEAASKGPYIPVTYDPAVLMQSRIRTGRYRTGRADAFEMFKGIIDPETGKEIATEPKSIPTGKEIVDPTTGASVKEFTYAPPSPEYRLVYPFSRGGRPIAVREGFANTVRSLTDVSQFDRIPFAKTALMTASALKHGVILIGDIFHIDRLGEYATALSGKKWWDVNPGYKGGYSVLAWRPSDLAEAVDKGFVTPEAAAWAGGTIPVKMPSGRVMNFTRHDIGTELIRTGLNAGRIADALYKDAVQRIPLIGEQWHRVINPFNSWLFDRYTSGLILQQAVTNFERLHAKFPDRPIDALSKDVIRDLNTRFGNLGRQGVFSNPTFRDMAQVVMLAPMWREGLYASELRSIGRILGAGGDVMRGRLASASYRMQTPLVRSMIRGLGAMFVLTQGINLVTRGKFTWNNPEPDHKLDAFIPTVGGKLGEGIFISPASVFMEVMHDVVRLLETKPRAIDAFIQMGENMMGPLGRASTVIRTGESPAHRYIPSTAKVALTAAQEAFGSGPISATTPIRAAASKVAPELVSPPRRGMLPRTLAGYAGVKAEISSDPEVYATRFARKFLEKSKVKPPESFKFVPIDEPSYSTLRRAIQSEDPKAQNDAWEELLKNRSPKKIFEAMADWKVRPWTGSKQTDKLFFQSLTPEQAEIVNQARLARYNLVAQIGDSYVKYGPKSP